MTPKSLLVRAAFAPSGAARAEAAAFVVRRQLNVQPTLTIRQGFPVRVIVNRDLVLEPYPLEISQ